MKRFSLVLVLLCSFAFGVGTWAYINQGAVRGVYHGDKLHYVTSCHVGNDEGMGYYLRDVDTDFWDGPWGNPAISPTATIKLPEGFQFQTSVIGNEYCQGVVVFGAQIINTSVALDSKGHFWVIVTRYDLTDQKFLDCRAVCQLTYSHPGDGYGAAATVMDGKVYIFTSCFTLVSDDGYNYSEMPAVADGLTSYEPLDAVTFYPPEGHPKVLIAFSKRTKMGAGYVVWDGTSSLPLPGNPFQDIGSNNYYYRAGAVMLGTLQPSSYPCIIQSGKKVPCVQIFLANQFVMSNLGVVEHYEFDTTTGEMQPQGSCNMNAEVMMFRAYPWYVTTTDTSPDGTAPFYVQQQLLVFNVQWCLQGALGCSQVIWQDFPLHSDFLVPQLHDTPSNGYGWQGIPTNTAGPPGSTDDEIEAWRNNWSLVGVVLGPPPFRLNGIEDTYEIHELANVEYGTDQNDTIKHTVSWKNSMMFSSGTEVKAGPSKKAGAIFNFDVTYKQGWEGKATDQTTFTGGLAKSLGTSMESEPDWGTHGYAIFVVPLLLTQDMAVYAYDYKFKADPPVGTYLHQDLTTVVQAGCPTAGGPPAVSIETKYFSLQNPGGPDDEIPGLMTMQADPATGQPRVFPNSTDLDGWSKTVWEKTGTPWQVEYGTGIYGGSYVAPFGLGTTDATFGTTTTDSDSQGWSRGVEIQIGIGFFSKLLLRGLSSSLTAAYSNEYSDMTTNETEVSQDLKLSLHLPIPASGVKDPDYVCNMSIQPYLLKATDYTAPWIPENYGLNLPWCITWNVQGTMCDGRRIGASPPPGKIEGTIHGPSGAALAAGSTWSTYTIEGAHMVWNGPDGAQEPIPLTADTFDPGLGATVELNSHLVSAVPSLGTWTRQGRVWKFKSNGASGGEAVTLKLDFGDQTWSLDGQKLLLSDHFRAADAHVMGMLCVNGMYTFRFDAEQEVRSEWKVSLPPADGRQMAVTEYSGQFGWSDREDKVLLKGRLPETLDAFGDLSFAINGHQVDIPLLSLGDFDTAMARGKELTYQKGGVHVVVDFGKKKWSAEFKKAGFHRLMAPRWGSARIAVKVGGDTLYSTELPVGSFTTKLKYKG